MTELNGTEDVRHNDLTYASNEKRLSHIWLTSFTAQLLFFSCDENFLRSTVLCAQLLPSCPTLCNPLDCSPPGSSGRGILLERTLVWVVTSFSRGSSRPRGRTQVFHTAGGLLTTEPAGKPFCSPGDFQVYTVAVLTAITVWYPTRPELVYLVTGSVCLASTFITFSSSHLRLLAAACLLLVSRSSDFFRFHV